VAAAFDPKGERVVTVSVDKTARIWRAPPTGKALV
jgi:WD40 repeat protein